MLFAGVEIDEMMAETPERLSELGDDDQPDQANHAEDVGAKPAGQFGLLRDVVNRPSLLATVSQCSL